MKTKSITLIAGLLGAAVALNLSAIAGPGPQPQSKTQNVTTQKSAAVPAHKALQAPTFAFGGTKSSPTLTTWSGPHGTISFYR